MKKVFIVVGPESSGTRVITRLFCMSGCVGDYGHEQRLDRFVYNEGVEKGIEICGVLGRDCETIVLRRSIPYDSDRRPDILGIGAKFRSAGFEPYYIVTIRDWTCNAASKINMGHGTNLDMAKDSLVEEWSDIGAMFAGFNGKFCIVMTSSLFTNPERVISGLEDWTGLVFTKEAYKVVFDADSKYYEKKGSV